MRTGQNHISVMQISAVEEKMASTQILLDLLYSMLTLQEKCKTWPWSEVFSFRQFNVGEKKTTFQYVFLSFARNYRLLRGGEKNTKAGAFLCRTDENERLSSVWEAQASSCRSTVWYNNLLLGLSITFLIKHLYDSSCIYSRGPYMRQYISSELAAMCVCVCVAPW